MFLSKEKYDNIMLQLCRIRTEISTKDECGEACRMCEHAIGAASPGGDIVLVCEKKLKAVCSDFSPRILTDICSGNSRKVQT